MSFTAWDIKEAAFCSDVKDVEELILTNKGATDVGALSQATNLRSLSLAFNALSSLQGLAPLCGLQSLNVSHNQLASLKGLAGLSNLASLNAAHNKVASLAPLSALSALTDLWLQSNALADPGELRVLGRLPGLQRLAIASNPLAKALPAEHVRLVALRLCPALKLIDGRAVDDTERAASESIDVEALLAARAAGPSSAPPSSGGRGATGARSGGARPGPSGRAMSHANLPDAARAGDAANGGALPQGGLPSRTSALPPAAARRKLPRSSSANAAVPSTGRGIPSAGGTGSTTGPGGGGPSSPSADEALAAALEAVASSSSLSGSSGGARPRARRPPLPGATVIKPAVQLQGTQFQAVVDALPTFHPSKLPARYNGAAPKRAPSVPPPVAKPPPDANVVEYELSYPRQKGGGRGIVVRRDGSASAFWPGGDMAVTVDVDYGSPAALAAATAAAESSLGDDASSSDGAGDRAAAWPSLLTTPLPYKMMAMYRAGGVAVSWEEAGGFVQYPNGGLMLLYNKTTGAGSCYSPAGEITRRWRDPGAAPSPKSAIQLPPGLAAATSSPAEPPPPPPPTIDMQLDPHFGVRFFSSTGALHMYISCEGLRHRLRCGRNHPHDVWDPPPGRNDGGPGTTSASPFPSEPTTPIRPGGAVAAPWAGADTPLGGGADGDLPPPAFLRNLARQGGAGTHKPMGGGAKGGAGGGGGAGAGGGGGGAGGGSAVDVADIASITAGLAALEEGLQAMLTRDLRAKASSPMPGAPSSASLAASLTPEPSGASSPALAAAAAGRPGRRAGSGSGMSAARALAAEAAAAAATAAASTSGSSAAVGAATGPADRGEGGRAGGMAAAGVGARPGGRPRPGAAAATTGVGGGGGGAGAKEAPDAVWSDPGTGDGADGGGGSGKVEIDSESAAQLAAARQLAAASLAAAMAAQSAVAALARGRAGVEATYYGHVYDDDSWDDADSDDDCFLRQQEPIETLAVDTMQVPAKPLAALLRLLPSLHTVRLPPSTPFDGPEVDAVVLSALSTLRGLRELALPSFSLAGGLDTLSGLQHLTRLTVQSLYEADVEDFDFTEGLEDDLTPAGVQGICSLRGLQHLELRSVTTHQVFDDQVRQILDSLPSLERLVVRGLATQMVDELDEDVEADEDDERASLDANLQIALDLCGGHITSIVLSDRESKDYRNSREKVALGLVSYLARTLLLPRVAPAPAPPVKALSLGCEVTLGLTDAAGEWLGPLRELVERCEAVEVQGLDVTPRRARRRVTAAEVETLLRLLGKPQRLRLGTMSAHEFVGLRSGQERPPLECEPGSGCPARVPTARPPSWQALAKALQAVWDSGAGGTELQRLQCMMDKAGLSSGQGAERGWEYSDNDPFVASAVLDNDSDVD
ncbi:hypothetical protein HYH03_016512 [Edaphochlamys debaryana]|uniref:Uncharacterized protein n=1 Tax=Edaphochlamys debaryana TaxID=47281 RepID=A0A835XIG7_9CHLO|nr:hypothetical protein HYH03_016512 [Edaphochlamys debaryana]|eukprot:KAG2484683.1 hypothetical protein HYH03_016512 [Edaphochlamys debaryana]